MASALTYSMSLTQHDPGPFQNMYVMAYDDIIHKAFSPFNSTFLNNESLPSSTTIDLSRGGCQYAGRTNCAAACMDPRTLFNSTENFYNCLTLAIAADLIQDDKLELDETSVQETNQTMRFGDLNKFNSSQVTNSIASCVMDSCQNRSLAGRCSSEGFRQLRHQGDSDLSVEEHLRHLYNGLKMFCDGAGTGSNPDIVGPGVIISYIIQCVIISIFFYVYKFTLAIFLYPYVFNWLSSGRTRLRGYKQQRDSIRARNGDKVPWPKEKPRINHPVGFTLVDLQETQAIFVITIQFATLVFFRTAVLIKDSKTYAEAITSVDVVRRLAFDEMFPVLLGQVILLRAERHWWYTIFLTTIVFVLGVTCNYVTKQPDYAVLWEHFKESDPVEKCGGNPNPATYCFFHLQGIEFTPNYSKSNLINFSGLSWVRYWAIAFILLSLILRIPRVREYLTTKPFYKRHRGAFNKLLWFAWTGLQTLLVICLTSYLVYLGRVFTAYSGGTEAWTFGQLIAVLVWVPLAFKFIFYVVCGVENTMNNRVGEHHEVVQIPVNVESSLGFSKQGEEFQLLSKVEVNMVGSPDIRE
ncbi:hypothetical protein F5Y04DRAFT_285865 [Hypomontagnella monticulosa]|nr:hypothetical protein F5Y04DRAFT_285865 [Hypomontagnella monticulosa]